MLQKALQPEFDIADSGDRFPMIFGRKIQDLWWEQTSIKIRDAGLDFLSLAILDVVLEHLRKALLEFQGDSLPHDSHAVDRVNQGLGFGFQDVADQDFHISFLEKYTTPDTNGQSNIQLLKLLQSRVVRYN